MQTKKPAVEQDILRAALREFSRCGYRQASMRNIAELAGITVGNIYAYFPSKEALFGALVGQVAEQLNALIAQPVEGGLHIPYRAIAYMAQRLRDIVVDNRERFLLLVYGSEGSQYENTKTELTRAAAARIEAELTAHAPGHAWDNTLLGALAISVVEGLAHIILEAETLEHIDQLFAQFLSSTFTGMGTLCQTGGIA